MKEYCAVWKTIGRLFRKAGFINSQHITLEYAWLLPLGMTILEEVLSREAQMPSKRFW